MSSGSSGEFKKGGMCMKATVWRQWEVKEESDDVEEEGEEEVRPARHGQRDSFSILPEVLSRVLSSQASCFCAKVGTREGSFIICFGAKWNVERRGKGRRKKRKMFGGQLPR